LRRRDFVFGVEIERKALQASFKAVELSGSEGRLVSGGKALQGRYLDLIHLKIRLSSN
jgi:hypothetical protein